MSTKNELGQFYTTNYEYILQNLKIPDNIKIIIEPFAGNCDLLKFINNINNKYIIELYDIDPKKDNIIKRDTLDNPPLYNNKFIITNPPYLARNKSKKKYIFDKYEQNDLYKCFIKELCKNKSLGGILIIPLNFWSSIRTNDINLRKEFLNIYNMIYLNIFEERVFDDTSYTVCSFQFELKLNNNLKNIIKIHIHPTNKIIEIELNDKNNYIIGGEIYNLDIENKYNISRCTTKNKNNLNTNILAKCIDDNLNNKIKLSLVNKKDLYIDDTPNQTARTYATLIITPQINLDKQKKVVEEFNIFLNNYRDKYNSLFLTNYRESKDIARKRISFDLIYNIVKLVLHNIDNIDNIDNKDNKDNKDNNKELKPKKKNKKDN